jgi:choline dehydrogenase-like flavoprotein
MSVIRSALNKDGFFVPPGAQIRQKSNTHYAGTLPYGESIVPVTRDAQIAPGIFVCDASVFPKLPAVSLTFTIMANAHRIAIESL